MSKSAATQTHYTPEDLLAMPDGKNHELVGGQLVERKSGMESSWVGGRVLARLDRYCEHHGFGWVFAPNNGFQCFVHDPERVRRPAISFVKYGRFPGGVLPEGWAKIPPDLAVEVVSPTQTAYELEDKLEDYWKARVPLVWVISPHSRTIWVRRSDGSTSRLREDAELSGEGVIPGFRCSVREIFRKKEPSPEVQPSSTGPNGAR
jgi:Uma2 family endonuclease